MSDVEKRYRMPRAFIMYVAYPDSTGLWVKDAERDTGGDVPCEVMWRGEVEVLLVDET